MADPSDQMSYRRVTKEFDHVVLGKMEQQLQVP